MNRHGYGLTLGCLVLTLGCDPEPAGTGSDDGGATGTAGTADDAGDGGPGVTSTAGVAEDAGDDATDDGGSTGGGDTGGGTTGGGDTDGGTTGGGTTGGGDTDGDATDDGTTDDGDTGGESDSGDTDAGESEAGESDAGESGQQLSQITGTVVADISPGGDGVGTLYVGLAPDFDCFDGSSAYTDVIPNADLSQIGNAVPFSLDVSGLEASGSGWVLQVFLDDNENTVFESTDAGDMTLAPPPFMEEDAGCFPLPDLDGDDIDGLTIELDYIQP